MKIGKSAEKARQKETLAIPNFYTLINIRHKETTDILKLTQDYLFTFLLLNSNFIYRQLNHESFTPLEQME